MKNLLITLIAICCFYGCKSTLSEESAFSINSRKTIQSSEVVTEKIFTDITKSLDPIGIIWNKICNYDSWNISIGETFYKSLDFEYIEKIENSTSSKNIQHFVSLNKPNSNFDNIIYLHKFKESSNSSKDSSDTDEANFFKTYGTVQYLHRGDGHNSIFFENLNESSTDEKIEEFCQKYKDAYNETKANYKVVVYYTSSEKIKITKKTSFLSTTEYIPTLYSKLEGINEKVGESIETWTAASGPIEGISLKTIEKDSNGTSTKTMTSYKLTE